MIKKIFIFTFTFSYNLTEEEKNSYMVPTKQNIRQALEWLVQDCQPGDSWVFHYSGHGSRQKDYNKDELDGFDETICLLEHETEGPIIDDEINATIVRLLLCGAKLHAIIDSCYSGTVLDEPFVCKISRYLKRHDFFFFLVIIGRLTFVSFVRNMRQYYFFF